MVMPLVAQSVITSVLFGLYALVMIAALVRWLKTGSPLFLLLMIGAALGCVLEPLWDVMSHVWYAARGQWVGMQAFNISVPIWGYPAFGLNFGLAAYLLLTQLERGIQLTKLRIVMGALILGNLLLEVPMLHTGAYVYYGNQGITIGGMPVYWLFIQVGTALATATVIHRKWVDLSGWRAFGAILLPPTAETGITNMCGWPMFVATNMPVAQGIVWP
jgi:hypothetical protein